jgi:esterase/lipase
LPGFTMQIKDKPFRWLVKFLKDKRFRVVPVSVDWKYKTLSQNAEEFIEFFNKNKGKENYILGFSFGAVLTLLTANILKPKKIYLCSLSSDFSEDKKAKIMKPWIMKYIGKKRYEDIDTRSGVKLAKELKVPSVVFYGEKEGKQYPQLQKRCEETAKLAKNSKLVVVKNSPHKIDFPEYIEEIKKVLSTI